VKTDEFVAMLSTGVEAVDSRLPARKVLLALAVGMLFAFALVAGILKVNPTLGRATAEPMFWVRELYCAALGALALMILLRLALPGRRVGLLPGGIVVLVAGMWVLALEALAVAVPETRARMIVGHTAIACPFLISLAATPLFIAFVRAVQYLAPTRLRRTGAACGFAAGALGALVYTLHCPELAAPFIGTWYLLGMLIPTAAGTVMGPRLLRW
jgi:hypothetical protein